MSTVVSDTLPSGTSLYGYTILELQSGSPHWVTYRARHELLQRNVLLHEFFPRSCAGRHPESMMVLPQTGREDAFMKELNKFGELMRRYAAGQNAQVSGFIQAMSEEGLTFCVQPMIQGTELYSALPGNAGEDRLRPLLEQALDLVKYAVTRGMPLDNLGPSAFYLAADGTLQLSLFGVQALDADAGYTALECVQRGGRKGEFSYVYTLGAMFYSLIMGQSPIAVTTRMGRVDPYLPLAGNPGLKDNYTESFLAGIDKALALWVEDRWPDFAAWQKSLHEDSKK